MASGDFIAAADYNAIRTKVNTVLGVGSSSYGYGQTVQSTAVAAGNTFSKTQWDALRYDIYNCLYHQTGTVPSLVQVNSGDVIRFGASHPNNAYDTAANTATTNRFNLGTGQYVTENQGSTSKTDSWYSSVSATVTVNFTSATVARHFFNAGGKIRFSSTRTGGTSVAQNTSWSNLLSSVGTRAFDGNTGSVNFYTLTGSYQTFYTLAGSTPYTSNSFSLDALCNVSNNSSGTATQITFRARWVDNYTDPGTPAPGDMVDGTLTLNVDQIRATGYMYPQPAAGNFTITGPSSYTLSAITGS